MTANENMQCEVLKKWHQQTDFNFWFVPLTDFLLPDGKEYGCKFESLIEQHYAMRHQGVPNFLGARSPVSSQLNVEKLLGYSAVGTHVTLTDLVL